MRIRSLLLAMVFAFLCLALQAQTSGDSALKTKVSGEVYSLARFFYRDQEASSQSWQAEARGVLRLQSSFKETFQAKVTLIGNVNAHTNSRMRLWVNEAFVSYKKGKLFINVGKQTVKWGTLTGFSSFDLANRYDYYDLLDTENERLGLWGIDSRLNLGKTEIQVRLFQPDNRSMLHLQDNRWIDLPKSIPHPNLPGEEVPVFFGGSQYTFNSSLPAVGISLSSRIGAVEVKGKWLSANNDIPISSISLPGNMGNVHDYIVNLEYRPIHIGGFNISTWLGSWNIWSEVSHVESERYDNAGKLSEDPYSFVSFGTDRFWQFDNPEKQLRMMVQYIKAFSWIDENFRPDEFDHIFQNSILIDLMMQLTYTWKVELRSVADMDTKGYYFAPNIEYRPSDKIQVKSGADILAGNSQSFFGNQKQNTRIYIHLTYYPF